MKNSIEEKYAAQDYEQEYYVTESGKILDNPIFFRSCSILLVLTYVLFICCLFTLSLIHISSSSQIAIRILSLPFCLINIFIISDKQMVSDTVVVKWPFFVVKRTANHYWFTALSSNHVCNIKEMKQTPSLVYAGIRVYLHLLYLLTYRNTTFI